MCPVWWICSIWWIFPGDPRMNSVPTIPLQVSFEKSALRPTQFSGLSRKGPQGTVQRDSKRAQGRPKASQTEPKAAPKRNTTGPMASQRRQRSHLGRAQIKPIYKKCRSTAPAAAMFSNLCKDNGLQIAHPLRQWVHLSSGLTWALSPLAPRPTWALGALAHGPRLAWSPGPLGPRAHLERGPHADYG